MGLGGYQGLFHITRLSKVLLERGVHVLRMNMRGRGPSRAKAPNALLGGHSDDLAKVVQMLHTRLSPERVDLLGYSFGGNMVLRYAGVVSQGEYPPVQQCIAVSAPVDLAADVRKLKGVVPRSIQRRVVKNLVSMAQRVHQGDPALASFPEDLDLEGFESLYVGPMLGDGDSEAFYRSISAGPWVHKIGVPTKLVWAQDDPAVDVQAYARYAFSDAVQGYCTRYGGHVGFCRPFALPPKRWWLDEVLLEFLDCAI